MARGAITGETGRREVASRDGLVDSGLLTNDYRGKEGRKSGGVEFQLAIDTNSQDENDGGEPPHAQERHHSRRRPIQSPAWSEEQKKK